MIRIVFHLNAGQPPMYMKGIRTLILDYASGQAKVQRILLIHTMSASAALQANSIHYDSVLPNKLVYQNKCTTLKCLIEVKKFIKAGSSYKWNQINEKIFCENSQVRY